MLVVPLGVCIADLVKFERIMSKKGSALTSKKEATTFLILNVVAVLFILMAMAGLAKEMM